MIWDNFIFFALCASLCWISGSITVYLCKNRRITDLLIICGIIIFGIFIGLLWKELERPPLRTLGETRLWYSFFLISVGFITYKRWKYKWLLGYCTLVAIVFIIINILKPEIHSKSLMPALQSYWFIPHVTVYMLSYATLGAATIVSVVQIFKLNKNKTVDVFLMDFIDNIVYVGFAFLALAMLLGAIWAKEAWGHYWSWDPKETWAFITGLAYLIYIHVRLRKYHLKKALYFLPVAFILLMIAWVGVNYLPSAKISIHTYSQQP